MYKIIQNGDKGTRYMKDGKFIAKDKVPEDVRIKLDRGELNVPVEEAPPVVREKECIFCGAHTNLTRMVNLQTVALCEEHYYSETIGKVAQKLNERMQHA